MIRIAIVEDDLQAARRLQEQLEQFGKENNVTMQTTLSPTAQNWQGTTARNGICCSWMWICP